MRDRVENLEAALGQFRLHQIGEARAEQAVLVDEHDGLDRLARAVVQLDEIVERLLAHDRGAGREAERVLEPAR